MYYPCLKVLPIGFSWSFWIVQEMVTQLSEKAGVSRDRILVSGWPAPSLHEGIVANPYCDNLNVFGTDPAPVNACLKSLISVFENVGFEFHEMEWASTSAKPLGSRFSGKSNVLGPHFDKLHNLKSANRFMSPGTRVSGQQVEVLLGIFTHEFMYNRSGFSVFRAAYTFVQDSYYTKQHLWDSVAREFMVAGYILLLIGAKLNLDWSTEVRCSDASTAGWGSSFVSPLIMKFKKMGSGRNVGDFEGYPLLNGVPDTTASVSVHDWKRK